MPRYINMPSKTGVLIEIGLREEGGGSPFWERKRDARPGSGWGEITHFKGG